VVLDALGTDHPRGAVDNADTRATPSTPWSISMWRAWPRSCCSAKVFGFAMRSAVGDHWSDCGSGAVASAERRRLPERSKACSSHFGDKNRAQASARARLTRAFW